MNPKPLSTSHRYIFFDSTMKCIYLTILFCMFWELFWFFFQLFIVTENEAITVIYKTEINLLILLRVCLFMKILEILLVVITYVNITNSSLYYVFSYGFFYVWFLFYLHDNIYIFRWWGRSGCLKSKRNFKRVWIICCSVAAEFSSSFFCLTNHTKRC